MPSAQPIPVPFDRALLRKRLLRALRTPEDFLLRRAADEIAARLTEIQRAFPNMLALGAPTSALARALALDGRRVVWAAPIPLPVYARKNADLSDLSPDLVADEAALPFGAAQFDCIASALTLQWVNDLPGTLVQIRRSLKPDGLLIACLIGGQSLQELRASFAQAEDELTGGASPRVAPLADIRDLGNLLGRAGFALPVTDSERLTIRYDSLFALMADLRAMGATNALTARARTPLTRTTLLRAAQIYAGQFSDPDGRIRATFDMIWLSGWAPHESQQKPLKPGSAQMRLADALKGATQGLSLK